MIIEIFSSLLIYNSLVYKNSDDTHFCFTWMELTTDFELYDYSFSWRNTGPSSDGKVHVFFG